MDQSYWIGRWERGETGWHQQDVEPGLVTHFKAVEPTRVLVPLCGKSKDLIWLASQGHEAVGVELSPIGIEAFFAENRIPFEKTQEGSFIVYRGGGITIFNGDFFHLTPSFLGSIGAVYDRAALIALPPEIRARYAAHLIGLVRACASSSFHFLQIVLERTPHVDGGPPFSVSQQNLEFLYGRDFRVSCLSREEIDLGSGGDPGKTEECIYQLSLI